MNMGMDMPGTVGLELTKQLLGGGSLLPLRGPQRLSLVTRHGRQLLYPLSHLASLMTIFNQ